MKKIALILHLLLRDFLKALPLVSKIFAKDSPGIPAHGFDSVHIGNSLSNPVYVLNMPS
jgi:hypothetical protein